MHQKAEASYYEMSKRPTEKKAYVFISASEVTDTFLQQDEHV